MLNPSTANADTDDATSLQCVRFAKKWGNTQLTIVNLFAYISTDQRGLLKVEDPVGPDNARYLEEEIRNHSTIVAAWSSNKLALERGDALNRKYGPFQCLKIGVSGAPYHPLYLSNDTPLIPLPFLERFDPMKDYRNELDTEPLQEKSSS